eukprot:Lankesteria_metandrocarpae@DN5924_c0_g1_i1.p1
MNAAPKRDLKLRKLQPASMIRAEKRRRLGAQQPLALEWWWRRSSDILSPDAHSKDAVVGTEGSGDRSAYVDCRLSDDDSTQNSATNSTRVTFDNLYGAVDTFGMGRVKLPDGGVYEGCWLKGRPHGCGRFRSGSG